MTARDRKMPHHGAAAKELPTAQEIFDWAVVRQSERGADLLACADAFKITSARVRELVDQWNEPSREMKCVSFADGAWGIEAYYSPDADIASADWIKRTWDLPPYGSKEFFEVIGGVENLETWKEQSAAYKMAVERGLIHDDEWVLDWCTPVLDEKQRPSQHDATEPRQPGNARSGPRSAGK